jgi:hypothetical protein
MKCSKTSSVYMAATFMGTVLSLITMALFWSKNLSKLHQDVLEMILLI